MDYKYTIMKVTTKTERLRAISFYLSQGFTEWVLFTPAQCRYIVTNSYTVGGAENIPHGCTEIPLPPNPLLRRRNV